MVVQIYIFVHLFNKVLECLPCPLLYAGGLGDLTLQVRSCPDGLRIILEEIVNDQPNKQEKDIMW